MLSPLFETGPDQIVVELKPQATEAPANLLAPAAPGGPLAGFALPPAPELFFTPMFRVGGPIAEFAHMYESAPGNEPQRRDSGAIMVGAGAPPNGLFGPDRSRLDFSNYGNRVDCQGWGRSMVTLGYGDLRSGSPQQQYTAQFSGTSSASPIVTAVCACVQSYARSQQRALLDCATLRDWLRNTGSPQTNGPNGPATQRIGNRPNLRELLARVAPPVA